MVHYYYIIWNNVDIRDMHKQETCTMVKQGTEQLILSLHADMHACCSHTSRASSQHIDSSRSANDFRRADWQTKSVYTHQHPVCQPRSRRAAGLLLQRRAREEEGDHTHTWWTKLDTLLDCRSCPLWCVNAHACHHWIEQQETWQCKTFTWQCKRHGSTLDGARYKRGWEFKSI